MLNTPFSPWPSFSQEEADAVQRVLLSNRVNYWTGQECREFEKEFAALSECEYAVAVANGTVALELALNALELGEGDEVIVTSRTFIASASCIVYAGARPVFADIDRTSQNITAETIAAVVTPKTRAIIAVHFAGWPCEMDSIMALADERNLVVLEDCAQAHGAKYKGRSVGSIGHIGCWSFCQDKIISTGGEGGMITTNNKEFWSSIWSQKDHGKSWEAVYERSHPPGYRWLHESFGVNGRLTEMQAAIGRIQLKHLAEWTARRQANSATIDSVCKNLDILRIPIPPDYIEHGRYKHYVFVRPERLNKNWSRDRIIDEITHLGVPCYQGSCSEIYLEKAFDDTGFRPEERLPIARELGETSLMFLVHPTLTAKEIQVTCEIIDRVMTEAMD